MTAAHGLDGLLPTELLNEALSAALHGPADEFPHHRQVGTTMALRLAVDGEIDRAIKLAESFGPEAHHLLIEVARVAPPESSQWSALIAALRQSSASILTDGDSAAVLLHESAVRLAPLPGSEEGWTWLARIQGVEANHGRWWRAQNRGLLAEVRRSNQRAGIGSLNDSDRRRGIGQRTYEHQAHCPKGHFSSEDCADHPACRGVEQARTKKNANMVSQRGGGLCGGVHRIVVR